jgi:hypothetical protein
VLAADVSRSVDQQKFELQRQGYAAAIADRQVLEAIRSGRNGRIAVLFIEWSGSGSQQVVIDWTMIDGAKAAHSFGGRLLEAPRSFANRTSISTGIDFAAALFARAPFASDRRTIDVSSDGTNNAGRAVTQARDAALAHDITINGLVILSERPFCAGIRSTPICPGAWQFTTAQTSSAALAASCWKRRTFIPSAKPSSIK